MSKRFGRNQRRRAREEIAALKTNAAGAALALARKSSEAEYLRDEVRRRQRINDLHMVQLKAANEILGPSIALPPVEEVLKGAEFTQLLKMEQVRATGIMFSHDYAMNRPCDFSPTASMAQAIRSHTLDLIEGGIEAYEPSHRVRSPHAYVRTQDGRIVYRVSLPDLAALMREEGINRITRLLSESFIDDIRRFYGNRNSR